jgi:hypothetical protein
MKRRLAASGNKLHNNFFRSLEKLKGMKQLTELKLTGNPLVERLGSSYTATVRKIFPSLKVRSASFSFSVPDPVIP